MKHTKITTNEYDEEGRLVKQTVVTDYGNVLSAEHKPPHPQDVPVKVIHQGTRPARRSSGLGFI